MTMRGDGSFTFIPNPGFAGHSTSFTYKVFDNGYSGRLCSLGMLPLNWTFLRKK